MLEKYIIITQSVIGSKPAIPVDESITISFPDIHTIWESLVVSCAQGLPPTLPGVVTTPPRVKFV